MFEVVNKYIIVSNYVYYILNLESLPDYEYKIKYRICNGRNKERVEERIISLTMFRYVMRKNKYDDLSIAILRMDKDWEK